MFNYFLGKRVDLVYSRCYNGFPSRLDVIHIEMAVSQLLNHTKSAEVIAKNRTGFHWVLMDLNVA
jgi:hypothetical protein